MKKGPQCRQYQEIQQGPAIGGEAVKKKRVIRYPDHPLWKHHLPAGRTKASLFPVLSASGSAVLRPGLFYTL